MIGFGRLLGGAYILDDFPLTGNYPTGWVNESYGFYGGNSPAFGTDNSYKSGQVLLLGYNSNPQQGTRCTVLSKTFAGGGLNTIRIAACAIQNNPSVPRIMVDGAWLDSTSQVTTPDLSPYQTNWIVCTYKFSPRSNPRVSLRGDGWPTVYDPQYQETVGAGFFSHLEIVAS